MEELLIQLEVARQERVAALHEFMRLKTELARAQRRVDELRGENAVLKQALLAAENETQALFSALSSPRA
jgi:predicted nuclease with TOPRIM domain